MLVNFMLYERQNYIHIMASQYQKASKKERTMILNHATKVLAMNRSYLAHCLSMNQQIIRIQGGGVTIQADIRKKSTRKRISLYSQASFTWLRYLWKVMHYCCDKRLHGIIPKLIEKRCQFEESHEQEWEEKGLPPWTKETEKQLQTMSVSTIYRYLRKERKRYHIKGISHTRPGSLLKQEIEVKTFAMWDKTLPGYLQMDLVGHEGGDSRGCFAFSLNMCDVSTQWTETISFLYKSQLFVHEGIVQGRGRFPFSVFGLHSDNGSEFINDHLYRYCKQEKLTFTRNRKSFKNDSCYIEQKNWSIVRSYVGYARYDTLTEVQCINSLYQVLRLYTNYFQPVMQLQEKIRIGAKVMKRWDSPRTPYERVMENPRIPFENKQCCQKIYDSLDPFQLYEEVCWLKNKLNEIRKKKELDQIHAQDTLSKKVSTRLSLDESSKTFGVDF